MNRLQLERRIDELAATHAGRAFAEAIQEFGADLDAEELEVLRDILVERAINFDQAVMERVDARGWLQRQWDRTTASSPPGNKRNR